MRKCLVSQNSFASIQRNDLSNVIPDAAPAVVVMVRYRITPGKVQDFENLIKSDVLPVYKKAKVGLTVAQRGVGANPGDVVLQTLYSKYADLDGGPFLTKALGQDAANKLNAKFLGIRTLLDVVVRTRVADLSF